MPNYTIHELFTSMNAAASGLDYRNKNQAEWSTWDWLCALRDGIKGEEAGEYREEVDGLRAFLYELTKLKGVLPPLTEEEMMANFGRRFLELTGTLNELPVNHPQAFSEAERNLLQAASDNMGETDSLDDIENGEREAVTNRLRRDAFNYAEWLIAQRREEEKKAAPDREQLINLSSQMYVANYIHQHAQNWVGGGYPEVFRRADVKQISDKLLQDPAYRGVMEAELAHPVPQNVDVVGVVPDYVEGVVGNEDYLEAQTARVHAAVPNNMLTHNIGGQAIPAVDRPYRLALLRDVKKQLDATGTGYTWYWPSRRKNSDQYEDVRKEIQRQIDRLECGLPIGAADEIRMIQVLNAYSAGRENAHYDYAKTRQANVLRLYAEYAGHPGAEHGGDYPTADSIMQRYNQARGTQNAGTEGHVDLFGDQYSFQNALPGCAALRQKEFLNDLKADLHIREIENRPLEAQEQLALRQKLLRMSAIHNIMVQNRAGIYAEADEGMIRAEMARIEANPRAAVHGMITAAVRNPAVMRQTIEAFEFSNEQTLHDAYVKDPDNFADPLEKRLRDLSYPTVQERLELAEHELINTTFPETGVLSQEQLVQFANLSQQIYTLRGLMANPDKGPNLHLSEDDFGREIIETQQSSRQPEIVKRAAGNAFYASAFRSALLNDNYSFNNIETYADYLANGLIDEQLKETAEVFRTLPAGEALPDDEAKENMRAKLVHAAAVNNLRFDRDARFPGHHFRSDTLYTSEEIEAAENDVRQNQPAFMQAIEPYLTSSDSVKQAYEDMASTRYARLSAQNEAAIEQTVAALSSGREAEITQAANGYRERFAAMIAIRNLQQQAGGLNMPVSEEVMQAEIARAKLTDEYLAVDRMIRTNPNNLITLQEHFSHFDTIDARLDELKRTVVVPEARNNEIGSGYQLIRGMTFSSGDPQTAAGRSFIAMNVFRALAYREQVLAAADGQYAPIDQDALQRRFVELSTGPRYGRLFTRIMNSPQTAVKALGSFLNAKDLYTMKVEQLRAQAAGQPYADEYVAELDALSALRYDEIYSEGMQQLTALMGEVKAGVPLNNEQKWRLLNAAAQMIIARRAPGGDSTRTLPDEERNAQIRELTYGNGELARDLAAAIDKAAMDGGKIQEILDMVTVSREQIPASVRAFSSLPPAKWAGEAWDKLQAAGAEPRPNITREEREDLIRTYALMAVMRERAADPQLASQPVSLAEAMSMAGQYLQKDGNDVMIAQAFRSPFEAVQTRCMSKRISLVGAQAPAEGENAAALEAEKLQQVMAMRNLQKKYNNDHVIVSEREYQDEMGNVAQSLIFRILTDPRNDKVPAVTAKELANGNIDVLLEGTAYNSPARKAVLLGDTPENSFAGRRILAADELRHDNALGIGPQAERLHIAELYALCLYNDGTFKEENLPDPGVITDQARRIANLPDFKTAMDAADRMPEQKEALLNALKSGVPASQITAQLNQLSQQQRRINNTNDVRKSDLHYDVRAAMVQINLEPLRQTDAIRHWSTEEEAREALNSLNKNKFIMTQDQARSTYLNFLASNRLYMRNPGRTFFSTAEMNAARTEVESDPAIQADLTTVLNSPRDMRLNIFNLAPSQYWSEIRAMEEGRDAYLNGPGGDATKVLGLQVILFSLAPIVESRLNGRDISGQVVSNDDLAIERNRIAFSEEFIALENALRHDINELDRIKDVLKLPADQFPAAFKALTDEYKEKYPEAEIPDKNSIGGDYLRAKEKVLAVENADFANDAQARKQLADSIREIMTIRNVILTSRYDVATKRNTASESDSRNTNSIEAAEAAGKHHITMRLGTPAQLEEKLKDPAVAKQFIDIMKNAEDLRRLYGKKLAAGREIVDPLEQQILDQGLDAPVPSHAERQLTVINQIMNAVPNETPEHRTARLTQQIGSLFNLVIHAAGTDPKDMPSDEVLAAQTQKILEVPDFGFAAQNLAKDPNKLTAFINRASLGMTSVQMADELNRLSAEEQLARDPEAEAHPNILFRLRVNAMNEANLGLNRAAMNASDFWSSKAERDASLRAFMHYTAVNRLMTQHPGRMYFSDAEIQDSFLQAMNDEQLQREYAATAAGGPIKVRKDLFSYGGGSFLTNLNMIEVNNSQLSRLHTDQDTQDAFHLANLGQFGVIAWLHENHLMEQNHFTTTQQTNQAASDFRETDTYKTLLAATKLDPREESRFMARLLPLSGEAFTNELNQVVNEYRAPMNMAVRGELNRRLLGDYADSLITDHEDIVNVRHYKQNLRQYLADALNIALHKGLPADEQPNTEEFLRQRDTIMALPEFRQAATWLGEHPQELKALTNDLKNGLTDAQLLARLNEASIRQQREDEVANPSSNLAFSLQRSMMNEQRNKYWSKCSAETKWPEGEKDPFREDFLDFIAMDALIRANPHRVWFSKEEIRAARLPFEQNPEFMAKLEDAIEAPLTARERICGFPADNSWAWTNHSATQMKTVQEMIRHNRNVSPQTKLDLMTAVTGNLAQAAVSKMSPGTLYYEPSERELVRLSEDLNATPAFRAMARELAARPEEMSRILNELYSLDGQAFRTKLEQMGRAYIKKHPQAQADSRAAVEKLTRGRQNLANALKKPQAQPAPKQEAPKNVINEAKPQNSINIINEPQNRINIINEAPKKAPKLKALQMVVPDPKYKNDPAMSQFQHSAGMLERTMQLQQQSEIPIRDVNFVKTAYQGILQTAAYRNLAAKPEYAGKKIEKDALNAEMERLKNDPALTKLPELVENGRLNTVLTGIKKLQDDPAAMDQFLRDVCKDPDAAITTVNEKHPGPAPILIPVPSLPKTAVKNDAIPKPADISLQAVDPASPLGRYKIELNRLNEESPHNRHNVMQHVTNLYGLRQIIAASEDPTAPNKYLETELIEKTKLLDNDRAFQNVIEPCSKDGLSMPFINHLKKVFGEETSFNQMTNILQRDNEKWMRYKVRENNSKVTKENEEILKKGAGDSNKEKENNLLMP